VAYRDGEIKYVGRMAKNDISSKVMLSATVSSYLPENRLAAAISTTDEGRKYRASNIERR
jgi:hypothetical protein